MYGEKEQHTPRAGSHQVRERPVAKLENTMSYKSLGVEDWCHEYTIWFAIFIDQPRADSFVYRLREYTNMRAERRILMPSAPCEILASKAGTEYRDSLARVEKNETNPLFSIRNQFSWARHRELIVK